VRQPDIYTDGLAGRRFSGNVTDNVGVPAIHFTSDGAGRGPAGKGAIVVQSHAVDRGQDKRPQTSFRFESAARRKVIAAKVAIGIEANTPIPKRTYRTISKNREKNATAMARLRARIASIRADSTHKLTTCLCRLNQAVLIEDLHVKGKLANNKRARSLGKRGF
jgi:hypothetical protein